jgi:hypothetical protein
LKWRPAIGSLSGWGDVGLMLKHFAAAGNPWAFRGSGRFPVPALQYSRRELTDAMRIQTAKLPQD